ncbi:hypothetical protein HMPREF1870_01217 [Bacteroidales bacterium KA00344]|nr:hypothetical protein HMPREF1870_01217 [Bacteroidales bacterium KA00344]
MHVAHDKYTLYLTYQPCLFHNFATISYVPYMGIDYKVKIKL